ncbi:hypothetical protein MRX96_031077 [Rhipicephalus microplus]
MLLTVEIPTRNSSATSCMYMPKARKTTNKIGLWEEIREALQNAEPNVTVEELQNRWKNLKNTYRKKLKEYKDQMISGSAAKPRGRAWRYMEHMQFMFDMLEPRQTHTSFHTAEQQELCEKNSIGYTEGDCDQPSQDLFHEIFREHTATPVTTLTATPVSTPAPIPETAPTRTPTSAPMLAPLHTATPATSQQPKTSRKRKRVEKELEGVNKELAYVSNALPAFQPLSDTAHFLLSLEPAMKEAPQHMQYHMRMELLNIVSAYSRGQYPDLIIRKVHPNTGDFKN